MYAFEGGGADNRVSKNCRGKGMASNQRKWSNKMLRSILSYQRKTAQRNTDIPKENATRDGNRSEEN